MSLLFVVAAVVFQSASAPVAISSTCRAGIDARVPGWRLSPPSEEVATWAKQNKTDTNILLADLDNDGARDTAVLVITKDGGPRNTYIGVCLERKAGLEVHVIREPYCMDGIGLAPKGALVYNYETGKTVRYRTNGVHAYCFEKAGGTYLYQRGKFVLVVDSD